MNNNEKSEPQPYWLLTEADGWPKCFRFVSEGHEESAYLAATDRVIATVAARRSGGIPRPLPPTEFVEELLCAFAADRATGVVVLTRRVVEARAARPPVISFASLVRTRAFVDAVLAGDLGSPFTANDGQNRVTPFSSGDPLAAARRKACGLIVPALEAAVRDIDAGVFQG
jgi:hypothetical protein